MRLHGYRVNGGVWVRFEQADMIPFNALIMQKVCQVVGVDKVSQVKQGGLDYHWLMTTEDVGDGREVLAAEVDSRKRASRYDSFKRAIAEG